MDRSANGAEWIEAPTARNGSKRQRRGMDRSANGAEWIEAPTARNGSTRQRRGMDRSANGAGYESQGQARSASPLVRNLTPVRALKGRNCVCVFRPFRPQ